MGVGPIAWAAPLGDHRDRLVFALSQLTYPPLSFLETGANADRERTLDSGHEAARDHRIRAFLQIPVRPT